LHYIIDNKDKVDPLLVNTPPRNTIFNDFGAKTFQLNDLLKGNHILSVELRSSNEPNVIYDYWDFPFKIDNEYFVPASGTFIDYRDNNSYKWVKIKDQVWMAENLAYLPYVNISSSGSTTVPQYYVYDYEGTSVSEAKSSRNYNTYGALYNWAAANTVCPAGWHLSTYEDWDKLITYLGGENIAGGKLKNGNDPWGGFENYGATNDYGFSAGGSGIRATSDTMFIRLDPQGNYYNSYFSYQDNCAFWTSLDNFSSGDNNSAFFHALYGHSTRIDTYFDNKGWGFSVRCLKDN
jgi:uncharacterized protein (TIGR02145 family)